MGRKMKLDSGSKTLTVNLADEGRLQAMRIVLAYESGVRGLTIGQTFAQMVMEAADVERYPEEVRARLAELEERRSWRAAARSLEAAGLGRSA